MFSIVIVHYQSPRRVVKYRNKFALKRYGTFRLVLTAGVLFNSIEITNVVINTYSFRPIKYESLDGETRSGQNCVPTLERSSNTLCQW